jgi:quinol monooxygenase YgiN
MIAVIAVFRVKPGNEAEFEQVFAKMTAGVKANEPEAHLYQLTRNRSEPGTYKALELYTDDAALDAHRASDHYKLGGPQLRALVDAPVEIEVLDTVG